MKNKLTTFKEMVDNYIGLPGTKDREEFDDSIRRLYSNTPVKGIIFQALLDPIWQDHKIGDKYTMDGKPDIWKIAYYPILEDGRTGEVYNEPRALVERPTLFNGSPGIDFREVPLRYLTKVKRNER